MQAAKKKGVQDSGRWCGQTGSKLIGPLKCLVTVSQTGPVLAPKPTEAANSSPMTLLQAFIKQQTRHLSYKNAQILFPIKVNP